MFDIGFSELLLVMIIGLVVLGPERLPIAVRTVVGWIRALRSLASSVQNELTQELKLQELQDSLKKAEQVGLQNLTPELKASMDELREAAEAMKHNYHPDEMLKSSGVSPRQEQTEIDVQALHDDVEHSVLRASVTPSTAPEDISPMARTDTSTIKSEVPASMQSTTSDR